MFSSHEYEKDRTFQPTERKGTLPKISSPAKKNTSDAEFSDDTSPIEKEKGVNDRKYDNNKTCNKDKEPVLPDDTSSVEMEEDVIERKDESTKNMMREKRMNAQMTPPPAEIKESVGDRNEINNGVKKGKKGLNSQLTLLLT